MSIIQSKLWCFCWVSWLAVAISGFVCNAIRQI